MMCKDSPIKLTSVIGPPMKYDMADMVSEDFARQLSDETAAKLLFGGNSFNEGRTFVERRREWRWAGPVSAVLIAAAIACWVLFA